MRSGHGQVIELLRHCQIAHRILDPTTFCRVGPTLQPALLLPQQKAASMPGRSDAGCQRRGGGL